MEEQRSLMVQDHEEGMSISELAEVYGVSRKTVYKWLGRHDEQGLAGLNDVSRRPHHSPNQVTAEMEAAIVAARHRWRWGPGKLRVKLCQQDSQVQWPAVSTIAAVLKAKGLVVSRRNRPRVPVQRPPYIAADAPNDVWNIDYKGWFRCGDHTRVDPLTMSDGCSRYLLRCQHVARTGYELTQPVFDAAFSEFGLPWAIHSDNGPPFASVAPGGLSKLSIWFVKLGIVVERSRPGCPQDNGRHERMHRTLKEAPPNLRRPRSDCSRRHFTLSNGSTTRSDRMKHWIIRPHSPVIRQVRAPTPDVCRNWSTEMIWKRVSYPSRAA